MQIAGASNPNLTRHLVHSLEINVLVSCGHGVRIFDAPGTWLGVRQAGVRGLMLDTYDFLDDIWLCHSSGGACNNATAFVSL